MHLWLEISGSAGIRRLGCKQYVGRIAVLALVKLKQGTFPLSRFLGSRLLIRKACVFSYVLCSVLVFRLLAGVPHPQTKHIALSVFTNLDLCVVQGVLA